MYANYNDYVNIYLLGRSGLIPEASFPYFSTRATKRINDRINVDSIDNVTESVIWCTCAIAERLFLLERENDREKKSISDSGTSITYNQEDSKELINSSNIEIERIMQENLDMNLLFTGV